MNSKIFVLVLAGLCLISNKVYAGECEQGCQKKKIEQYFTYLAKVYQEDSIEKDIDRLFGLFHQHVKYEHLEYEADFDRNEWLTAFKNNQKRGAYSAGQQDRIRVENYIFGKHHVAVEYSYGEVTNDGEWTPKGDQKLFALFGFDGNKIILVREYW